MVDHEHDSTYAENVVQYLESQGVLSRTISLREDRLRPELELCLDDCATAVLGFNSTLDHTWLSSGHFLTAAEKRRTPASAPMEQDHLEQIVGTDHIGAYEFGRTIEVRRC